jgi:hypothetical protein
MRKGVASPRSSPKGAVSVISSQVASAKPTMYPTPAVSDQKPDSMSGRKGGTKSHSTPSSAPHTHTQR